MRGRGWVVLLVLLLASLGACASEGVPAYPTPEQDYSHLGISDAEAASLLSLEQIDDYPLYTMRQYADYGYEEYKGRSAGGVRWVSQVPATSQESWACTLFAALADPNSRLFGRNFDWSFSPTLLLFSDAPDGYAAATLVNISYLGFAGDLSEGLVTKPLADLVGLLDAHHIPFDGLNEAGLAVGMAAVSPGNVPADPDKDTIGSLGIIRLMLDKAATVDQAIELIRSYNIDFAGGPPLHYLIADAEGDAALVEFYEGEIHVVRSETNWHQASNVLNSAVESPRDASWRYNTVYEGLEATQGILSFEQAFDLLRGVAQPDTQWSVVYGQSSGEIHVVMGQEYGQVHAFDLDMRPR